MCLYSGDMNKVQNLLSPNPVNVDWQYLYKQKNILILILFS